MWFLRKMMRISYLARKTIEEVLSKASQQWTLPYTTYKRQLQFYGHVTRRQELEEINFCEKIKGKRVWQTTSHFHNENQRLT